MFHSLQISITKTMFLKSYVSCVNVHNLRSGETRLDFRRLPGPVFPNMYMYMYMTEFIVIATCYIFLLLKLRIPFVPFLTASSAANIRVNECHSFTDRAKNPTKLKLSTNSLPVRRLPIRQAEVVCQFDLCEKSNIRAEKQ